MHLCELMGNKQLLCPEAKKSVVVNYERISMFHLKSESFTKICLFHLSNNGLGFFLDLVL